MLCVWMGSSLQNKSNLLVYNLNLTLIPWTWTYWDEVVENSNFFPPFHSKKSLEASSGKSLILLRSWFFTDFGFILVTVCPSNMMECSHLWFLFSSQAANTKVFWEILGNSVMTYGGFPFPSKALVWGNSYEMTHNSDICLVAKVCFFFKSICGWKYVSGLFQGDCVTK